MNESEPSDDASLISKDTVKTGADQLLQDESGRNLFTGPMAVGGFLGRKSDGEPGAKTIWRGLDQVHAAAETLRALRDGLG
jgi:hypothetical protein